MKKTIAVTAAVIVAVVAVIFFVKSPLLSGEVDGTTDANESQESTRLSIEYEYDVAFENTDDICKYSSNIVKAKLLSKDLFDPAVDVYHYEVIEDYADNTPDEIYVYDAYDSRYVVGNTYYLFLESNESALYPHTIYTSAIKKTVLDADETTEKKTDNGKISVVPSDVPNIAKSAVERKIVGTKTSKAIELSSSTELADIANEADVIAEIKLSGEHTSNEYSSNYEISDCKVVKGEKEDFVAPNSISLHPGLKKDTAYYVFLKYGETGDLVLFSREIQVVEKSEIDVEKII